MRSSFEMKKIRREISMKTKSISKSVTNFNGTPQLVEVISFVPNGTAQRFILRININARDRRQATIEVFSHVKMTWNHLHFIQSSDMKVPNQKQVNAVTAAFFSDDRKELLRVAKAILTPFPAK